MREGRPYEDVLQVMNNILSARNYEHVSVDFDTPNIYMFAKVTKVLLIVFRNLTSIVSCLLNIRACLI